LEGNCRVDPLPCASPLAPGLPRPVGRQRKPYGDGTGSLGIAVDADLSRIKKERCVGDN